MTLNVDCLGGGALASIVALPSYVIIFGLGQWAYLVPACVLTTIAVFKLSRYRGVRVSSWAQVYISLVCLWSFILMCTVYWTTSTYEYIYDFFRLALSLHLLVICLYVLNDVVYRWFLRIIVVVGLCTGIYVVHMYIYAGDLGGYAIPLLDYYLPISRLIAVAAVGCIAWWLTTSESKVAKGFSSVFLLAALALSLGRGALLSAVVISFLVGLYVLVTKPARKQSVEIFMRDFMTRVAKVGLVTLLPALTFYLALNVERTAQRFERMLTGGDGMLDTRRPIWEKAAEAIADSPIVGYGLSSSGNIVQHAHTHNMFMQVWIDGGVISVLLLAFIVATPFSLYLYRYGFRWCSSSKAIPALAMFLFLVMEYSKSMNIYRGRALFLIGLIAVWAVHTSEEHAIEEK